MFPDEFDPEDWEGLSYEESAAGDFTAISNLDVADIDLLQSKILNPQAYYWLDTMFDLDGDGSVSAKDHRVWVKDLKRTWFGDADLSGEFDSSDFVQVFQAGKYEATAGSRLGRRRLERRRDLRQR